MWKKKTNIMDYVNFKEIKTLDQNRVITYGNLSN